MRILLLNVNSLLIEPKYIKKKNHLVKVFKIIESINSVHFDTLCGV
jgi:hypothetical protein